MSSGAVVPTRREARIRHVPVLNRRFVLEAERTAPMALIEDFVKGNLLPAAAVGAVALVLPKLLPNLPPGLRSAVKGGISLFLESESEAEGGIINRLANNALKNALDALSAPGAPEDRKRAARAVVENFKRAAHARAGRYGRNRGDRSARYGRHIAALRHAIKKKQSRSKGPHDPALSEIASELDQVEYSAD